MNTEETILIDEQLPKNIYKVSYSNKKKRDGVSVLYRVRIRTKTMLIDKCFPHLSTAIAYLKWVNE